MLQKVTPTVPKGYPQVTFSASGVIRAVKLWDYIILVWDFPPLQGEEGWGKQ